MKPNLDEVEPVDAVSTAARPVPLELDQLDLVYALHALRNKLREVVVRATTEGPRDCPWAELAALLDGAATLCRQEAARPNSEEKSCSVADSHPPGSRWRNVPVATDLDSPRTVSTVRPVEELDRSGSGSDEACPQCAGTGVIKWTQPEPDGSGGFTMRAMEHFCPRGCGEEWKHPHAERDRVVNIKRSEAPVRVDGHAKAANQLSPELDNLLEQIYDRFDRG